MQVQSTQVQAPIPLSLMQAQVVVNGVVVLVVVVVVVVVVGGVVVVVGHGHSVPQFVQVTVIGVIVSISVVVVSVVGTPVEGEYGDFPVVDVVCIVDGVGRGHMQLVQTVGVVVGTVQQVVVVVVVGGRDSMEIDVLRYFLLKMRPIILI